VNGFFGHPRLLNKLFDFQEVTPGKGKRGLTATLMAAGQDNGYVTISQKEEICQEKFDSPQIYLDFSV
jgi:hypothetical protein